MNLLHDYFRTSAKGDKQVASLRRKHFESDKSGQYTPLVITEVKDDEEGRFLVVSVASSLSVRIGDGLSGLSTSIKLPFNDYLISCCVQQLGYQIEKVVRTNLTQPTYKVYIK